MSISGYLSQKPPDRYQRLRGPILCHLNAARPNYLHHHGRHLSKTETSHADYQDLDDEVHALLFPRRTVSWDKTVFGPARLISGGG